jgi:hypothetical protein
MNRRSILGLFGLYCAILVMALVRSVVSQEPKACDDGWVKVWESGRYVCEPEEKTMAVFESDCISRVEVTKDSRIFMAINWQGKLDPNDWSSEHLKLTLKDGCSPHFEKLKVHQ